jgi:hypothetical protein
MIRSVKFAILAIAASSSLSLFAGEVGKDSGPSRESSAPGVKMPNTTPNRSVYFNGVDISSSRNQDLRNVQVKIAENGDVYIVGPQYQVTEEETFMPLSSYTTRTPAPVHRPPQELNGPNSPRSAKTSPDVPSEPNASAPAAPAQPASPSPPKTGG